MLQQLRDQLHRAREGLAGHTGTLGLALQEESSGRVLGQQGSIMEARLHDMRGGGDRGGRGGGHRERDRLKLLEERKKESSVSEPETLSAEERREKVRKQREAYFVLRGQKHQTKTPSTPIERTLEEKRPENQFQARSSAGNTEQDTPQQKTADVSMESMTKQTLNGKSVASNQTVKEKDCSKPLKEREDTHTSSKHQSSTQHGTIRTDTSVPEQSLDVKDGANAAGTCTHMYACETETQ